MSKKDELIEELNKKSPDWDRIGELLKEYKDEPD